MKVKRYDHLRMDGAKLNANGFLEAKVSATRTGIFVYQRQDGTLLRELRPADEVLKADSMATLRKIPVTNNHPTVPVTIANAKQYMVGMTGAEVKTNKIDEEEYLDTEVVIFDQSSIDEVTNGKEEVSCGYVCNLDMTPGIYKGQKYDAVQRDIEYNHLAIVDRGRAGFNARLRLDSGDAVIVDGEAENINFDEGVANMTKIKIDGVEYEVSEQVASAFMTMKRRVDGDLAAKDSKISDLEKSVAKIDEIQGKLDASEAENKKLKERVDTAASPEAINAAVKERMDTLKVAKVVIKDHAELKLDEMSVREIKLAVIKADCDFDASEKSDDYVNARYDHIAAAAENRGDDDLKSALGNTGGTQTQSHTVDSSKARKDSMKETSQSWNRPLGLTKRA